MLKTEVEYKATQRSLSRLEKQQWPFVMAKSLTQTAMQAQKNIRRRTARVFNLNTKFVLTNIKIIPSKKSDVKRGIVQSFVYAGKRIMRFMGGHEEGETRKGLKAKFIAVPGKDLPKNARTRSGRIKKRYAPGELLKRAQASKRMKKGKGKVPSKAFVIPTRNNEAQIVRRGMNRKPLLVLYNLKKRVKIRQRWDFVETVKSVAKNRFLGIFRKNMNKAMREIR